TLLPYLGERELYAQFHLDEAWDSPHNFELLERMPKVYAHPADPDASREGSTYYQVFVGDGTPFGEALGPRLEDFGDPRIDPAHFLVGTGASAVPWTKPDDLLYEEERHLPRLSGVFRGGSNVLFADGRVRFLRTDVDDASLRPSIRSLRPAGGWPPPHMQLPP